MIFDVLKLYPLYQAIRFDIRNLNYFSFESKNTIESRSGLKEYLSINMYKLEYIIQVK